MKKRQLTTNFDAYTVKDIRDFWSSEFLKEHQTEYASRGFVGNELHLLKQVIEEYGVYATLLAISNGIRSGEIAIKYFVDSISDYLPSTQYAKYVFLIRMNNNDKAKNLLNKLLFLESKWIPSGDDHVKKIDLINELDTLLG